MSDLIREQVALAPRTTIGLGGPARYLADCRTVDEIRAALVWATERDLPVHLLGGGSNTVFPDSGYPGLVLHLATSGIAFVEDGDAVRVTAAAGEDWDGLVATTAARGLGGVECLSGIPGQVGATPIQNVGAYGQEVGDAVAEVRVLDRQTLEVISFPRDRCGFGYRQSRFRGTDAGRYLILEVVFSLRPEARPVIRYPELQRRLEALNGTALLESGASALAAVRQAVLDLRRGKSMVVDPNDPDSRSVGSFFVNPVLTESELAALRTRLDDPTALPGYAVAGGTKVPAAWLIEQAGFPRGLRRGGAGISASHALALVNRGGTSRELLALAAEIQAGVERRFGVRLATEPVIVGGG
ncbi:MAG: UDP-N-acetylmuramate dehydrogenase [Candidatus Latescibacterota bacterium]